MPIYQGKIDKTLFQAQLQALGAAAGALIAAQDRNPHGADSDRAKTPKGPLRGQASARTLPRRELARGGLLRRRCAASSWLCRLLAPPSPPRRCAGAPPSGRSSGASASGSGAAISSPASFASSSARRSRRYSLCSSDGSKSPERLAITCWASVELRLLDRRLVDRLLDLRLRVHVRGDEERLERERVALRRGSGRASRGPLDEPAHRGHARSRASRSAAARTAAARAARLRGNEEVGAVEEDRIDLAPRRRSARSRSSASRRASSAPRAPSSSTSTNWPFATSQPLTISSGPSSRSCTGHQRFCLIGVPHSRCSMPEGDVRRARGGLRRRSEAHGDRDESEADRAVPGRAHLLLQV